jgi:PhnB protein
MLHTTPFLLFDGNCAEAMTFYHKCLGGELTPKQGNTFAIFVIGTGYDELKAVFDKLSEGIDKNKEESRFQELHDLPFGTYGQFIDKFGVVWQFKGDKRE